MAFKYLVIGVIVQITVGTPLHSFKGGKANKNQATACGRNEGHVGCEQTCADVVNWSLSPCRLEMDTTRCFCRSGFLRNQEGRCIPRRRCPQQQCPANSHFDWCGGHACASSECDPDPKCFQGYECIPGCKCDQGFFRHPDGNCTAKSACPPPPQCPENERYYPCLGCYEQTCHTRAPMCVRGCVSKGCFCAQGFVRNDQGKCVAPSECPEEDEQKKDTWTWE